jgi:hypothetical protein
MRYELKELARELWKHIYHFITHRILWLLAVTALLFYLLLVQLFELQVVMADDYVLPPPRTAQVTRSVPALRGTIYDRHGRPLAVNQLTFVVKMDPSISITNEALLELALLFERNNEEYVDAFPISRDEPFEFTFTGSESSIARQEHRYGDIQEAPLAGSAEIGHGGLRHMPGAVQLMPVLQIRPFALRLLNGVVCVDIAVGLLRRAN